MSLVFLLLLLELFGSTLVLLSGLFLPTVDVNPWTIELIVRFARVHLRGHSKDEEENALKWSLDLLSPCVKREDQETLDQFLRCPSVDTVRLASIESLPLAHSSLVSRPLWNLCDAFELALTDLHLNVNGMALKRLMQLDHLFIHHPRILLVGRSEVGKSLLIQSYFRGKCAVDVRAVTHQIVLSMWSEEQLFARFDSSKGLMDEGLLSTILRDDQVHHYLHLDGFHRDHLHSMEHFLLHVPDVHVIWEVSAHHFSLSLPLPLFLGIPQLEDLTDLSEELLSSFVVLHIDQPIWTWRDFVASSLSCPVGRSELIDPLKCLLFDGVAHLESSEWHDKGPVFISFQSKVSMALTLLKISLGKEKCSLMDLPSLVEYSLLWAFVTHVHRDDQDEFHQWWRRTFFNLPKTRSVRDLISLLFKLDLFFD